MVSSRAAKNTANRITKSGEGKVCHHGIMGLGIPKVRSTHTDRHTPDGAAVGVEGRELEVETVTEGEVFNPPA